MRSSPPSGRAAHRRRREQNGPRRLFTGSLRPHRGRISRFCRPAGVRNVYAVPVSALEGDNVVDAASACRGSKALRCSNTWNLCPSRSWESGAAAFPCAIRDSARCNFPRIRRPACVRRIAPGNERGGAAIGHEDKSEIASCVSRRNQSTLRPGDSINDHARRRN